MEAAPSAQSGIREVPEWLSILSSENFDEQCKLNMFCLGCRVSFCGHCCPSHHHPVSALQIKMNGAGVLRDELSEIFDCSDIEDKLCGTQVIPGSDGSRRTFLHGVALHRRTKSSSTVASAPGPTGNRCCPYGNSGSGKYCTVDCKHEALGGGNELVTKLLSQDFKSTHTRDRFCIDCCTSFGASFCSHHRNHKVLSLVNKDGVYYICFDGDEDWAYFFDSVDTKKAIEGGRVRRMMLLKAAPLPKNRCPCGRAVEKTHCSATCLARHW